MTLRLASAFSRSENPKEAGDQPHMAVLLIRMVAVRQCDVPQGFNQRVALIERHDVLEHPCESDCVGRLRFDTLSASERSSAAPAAASPYRVDRI